MSADVTISDHGIAIVTGQYDTAAGDGLSLRVAGESFARAQLTANGLAAGDGTAAPTVSPAQHEIGETDQPAFTNGWENAPGSTSVFYHYGPFVFIDIGVTGGTAETSVFTLPAGSRPAASLTRVASYTTDGATYTNSPVIIGTDGTVTTAADGDTEFLKFYTSFLHA